MQIVVKMKVILSPPGRILNEQPLTARVPRQPVPRERGGGRFVAAVEETVPKRG